ncbi:helix-turn-helix domain-containing protein [Lacticaseibacillus kribbianus]|uniref:helix-turn-helix domain-containing protein n=1 Tax=Lacticaseibacillus kribbianus TaxID=2926292 RepID=UPI001CD4E836|nr:helix-turn-helix transcriptional regulator [Lacticaseibacillus kribbianus]
MTTWQDYREKMTGIAPADQLAIDTLSQLQAMRIRAGISQKDFAARLGMKQPQLAKLERLDSLPTLRTLERYAQGLGMTLKLSIDPLPH